VKNILVKIHAIGMGDCLLSTPAIRKLSKSYGSKVSVQSYFKPVFERNPYVGGNYSFSDKIKDEDFEVFSMAEQHSTTKLGVAVHRKLNDCDPKRSYAYDLGFDLYDNELGVEFFPKSRCIYDFDNLKNYVCLHTTSNWPNRTWSQENWQNLTDSLLNNLGVNVVVFGKDHKERVFDGTDIAKECFVPNGQKVIDFTNNLSSLSDLWHLIENSRAIVTMDSGPLHVAGTTNAWIVNLGSARHPDFVRPFRNGSKNYRFKFIGGECSLFCASDPKYSVKEWGSINSLPYLPKCQENYSEFKCHPTHEQVFKELKKILS
jgi:ADP-heptose:LPS heptosyltransferase